MYSKFLSSILLLSLLVCIKAENDLKIGDEISLSNKKYLQENCTDCFGEATAHKTGLSQFQALNKKEYAKHDWEITKTKLYVTTGKSIKNVAFSLVSKTPIGGLIKEGLDPWANFVLDEAGNYRQATLKSKLQKSLDNNIDVYLKKTQLDNEDGSLNYAQVADGF